MIIAVSMRIVENSSYSETRDAISHDWVRRLDALPITPIFVPNVLRDPVSYLRVTGARGLLLTGGNDIGQCCMRPNERDQSEMALLGYAVQSRLPVFGVCRGLQLINVYFGGRLVRDLNPIGQHVAVEHTVRINMNALSEVPVSNRVVTNSFHNQGVCLSGLAADLKAFALAEGDVVEGVRHPNLPLFAVQWHPERPNPAAELDRQLMENWLRLCE